MAAVHFFSEDYSKFKLQTDSEKFGPVEPTPTEKYRVTNSITANADVWANAIVKSRFIMQFENGDPNSDKINIILKPTDNLFFNGSNIRYFIYRGIKKDSVVVKNSVTNEYNLIPETNPSIVNYDPGELVKKFYGPHINNQVPSSIIDPIEKQKYLDKARFLCTSLQYIKTPPLNSIYKDINKDSNVEELFNKQEDNSGVKLQSWIIDIGNKIGKFDKNSIGLEIIYGDFNISIEDLRKAETVIDANVPTPSTYNISKTYSKERILNYLDVAAFYGVFYKDTVNFKNEIFKQFKTSNRAYIDIRNKHNNSFNLYQNNSLINFTFSTTGFIPINNTALKVYETHDWPILICETNTISVSSEFIQLEITAKLEDYKKPEFDEYIFYISNGVKNEGNKSISRTELITNKTEIKINTDKVPKDADPNAVPPKVAEKGIFSIILPKLNLKNYDVSATEKKVLPTFIGLGFFKKSNENSPLQLPANNFVDNCFSINNLFFNKKLNWDYQQLTKSKSTPKTFNTQYVIHTLGKKRDTAAACTPGFASDSLGFYLFATHSDNFITSDNSKDIEFLEYLYNEINGLQFIQKKFKIQTAPNVFEDHYSLFDVGFEDFSAVNVKKGKKPINYLQLVAITKTEESVLANLVNSPTFSLDTNSPLRLGLKTENDVIDVNGRKYKKYNLVINGYTTAGTLAEVNSSIVFYKSADEDVNHQILFSEKYCEVLKPRSREAERLIKKMRKIYDDKKTIFGHEETFCGGRSFDWDGTDKKKYANFVTFPNEIDRKIGWRLGHLNIVNNQNEGIVHKENVSDISLSTMPENNGIGFLPGIFGWDIGWLEKPDLRAGSIPVLVNETRIDNLKTWISKVHYSGGINTITWHCKNPFDETECHKKDFLDDLPLDIIHDNNNIVRKITTNKKHLNKAKTKTVSEVFLSWIEKIANFFKSLKDSNGDLIPIIFRPLHEPNAFFKKAVKENGGFWWDARYCSPEDINMLYRLIHDKLVYTHKVTNVIFAFSMNDEFSRADIERYCPSDIVDIIGIDIYQRYDPNNNYFKSDVFIKRLKDNYLNIYNHSIENNQMAAITEIGANWLQRNPNWFTEVFQTAINDIKSESIKPKILYTLFWRNQVYQGLNIEFKPDNHNLDLYVPYFGQEKIYKTNFIQFIKDATSKFNFLFLGDALNAYKIIILFFLFSLFSKVYAQDFLPTNYHINRLINNYCFKNKISTKFPNFIQVFSDKYILASSDTEIAILSIDSFKILFTQKIYGKDYFQQETTSAMLDITGKYLIILNGKPIVDIWDWRNKKLVTSFDPEKHNVSGVSGNPNNAYSLHVKNEYKDIIYLGNSAGVIDIFDLKTLKWVSTYIKKQTYIYNENLQSSISTLEYDEKNRLLIVDPYNIKDSLSFFNLNDYKYNKFSLGNFGKSSKIYTTRNALKNLISLEKFEKSDSTFYLRSYTLKNRASKLSKEIRIPNSIDFYCESLTGVKFNSSGKYLVLDIENKGWYLYDLHKQIGKIINKNFENNFLGFSNDNSLLFFNKEKTQLFEINPLNSNSKIIKNINDIFLEGEDSLIVIKKGKTFFEIFNLNLKQSIIEFESSNEDFFFTNDKSCIVFVSYDSIDWNKVPPEKENGCITKILNLKTKKISNLYLN